MKSKTVRRTELRVVVALICALVMLTGPQAQAAEETALPLVRQLYNGNWPSQEEGQKLRDELFYQRAIHAYMMMLPALNTIGMRDGSEAVFGAGYNVLPIWKERMSEKKSLNPETLALTPDTIIS